MNLLLDTHVFLWMLGEPKRLDTKVAAAIQSRDNAVFVSAVSSVEIAIKAALGKLEAPTDLEDEIAFRGLSHMPFHFGHGAALRTMPFYHQDPFDRMLIAQAMLERLQIVTHDRKFERYPVEVMWT